MSARQIYWVYACSVTTAFSHILYVESIEIGEIVSMHARRCIVDRKQIDVDLLYGFQSDPSYNLLYFLKSQLLSRMKSWAFFKMYIFEQFFCASFQFCI